MSHLSFFILLLASVSAFSQKKWDGGGGNNQWSNALNWTGNTVPTSTDDVLLDNSIVTISYVVALPNTAVTVRSVQIAPSSPRTIDLNLPNTNTLSSAFTVNGPGYGMTIGSGGTFRNSSGSASGTAVTVLDSIRINNDGRYVHNSSSGHAANVMVLSRAPGTERGIFELDIPVASSTISISGRTFGKFVLRSTAAGGTCNYTAAGTSKVTIRNTLDIGAGVNFNLNCSDTILVGGDLVQEAGTLNLGNSLRSVVLNVQQNIIQNTGGVITETGTGTQTLLIAGSGLQIITFKGSIQNSVSVIKSGSSTASFKSPVSLPFKFGLKNGRVLTSQGLITLQAACTIEADTLVTDAFVDGPLKKLGLNNQSFLFPVGKLGMLRWLQVYNATGDYTVEYFKSDPHSVSSVSGSGVHHFSSIEYWDVNTAATSNARVKLSFVHPESGGVTNLSDLRVARLINGTWEDAGNGGVAGTPGSDGWVSSNAASGFSANSKLFALASANGLENPLPLSSIRLNMIKNINNAYLYWTGTADLQISRYVLECSYDGEKYFTVKEFLGNELTDSYSCTIGLSHADAYYRVVAISDLNGSTYKSNVQHVLTTKRKNVETVSNVVGNTLRLAIDHKRQGPIQLCVFNTNGVLVKSACIRQTIAGDHVSIDISLLPRGAYFLKLVYMPSGEGEAVRFVKL